MRSRSRLRVEAPCRVVELLEAPPIACRQAGDTIYLVGTAAGPLGDDDISFDLDVGPGARLSVRSAAATIAYSGPPSATGSGAAGIAASSSPATSVAFEIAVASGASLDWHLEPLVATSRCNLRVGARIALAPAARLSFTEELLLGRHGEAAGDLELELSVEVAGAPLLRHTLRTGPGALPGWDGPAVLGRARAVGLRLLAGPDVSAPARGGAGCGWACSPLEGPGVLVTAVADDLPLLRRRMAAAAEVAFPEPQPA